MKTLLHTAIILIFTVPAFAESISRTGGSHDLVTFDAEDKPSEKVEARARLSEKAEEETEKVEKEIRPVMSRTGGGASGLMVVDD